MSDLARALVDSLDDEALDHLARLLAPRLAGTAQPPTASLTVEQAAGVAGVSARTIRRALKAGLLDGHRVAGRWQTTMAALEAWQAAGGPTRAGGGGEPGTAPLTSSCWHGNIHRGRCDPAG